MSAPLATNPPATIVDDPPKGLTMHDVMHADMSRVFLGAGASSFADPVSIQPTGGIGFVISCLFDRVPRQDTITGEIQTWDTTITVHAEAVKHVRTGDKVVVRGKQYVISAMEPDGSGICIMGLSESING